MTDENNVPLRAIEIKIKGKNDSATAITLNNGTFISKLLPTGIYGLTITAPGYELYLDSMQIKEPPASVSILLHHIMHMLDEVKVVQKVLSMIQRDDTIEFNSNNYKVNPDADGTDLIRKMPAIDISGSKISAQGETVTKIVVDGQPFFSNDPYAALKNLPADMIEKVQVYNEKSDQEQFTGFSGREHN